MVRWDHEQCHMWLATMINGYVTAKGLGVIAGSRTALQINPFQVRLPDLSFICKDNKAEIRQQGVRGTPDLLIEIVSPSDGRADLISRETDYRTIGAGKIVFIYPRRNYVRALTNDNSAYVDTTLQATDLWHPKSILGFELWADWMLAEPRRVRFTDGPTPLTLSRSRSHYPADSAASNEPLGRRPSRPVVYD